MDKTIKIWNPQSGQLVRNLIGHTKDVNKLVVLTSGELASASDDNTARLWETQTGQTRIILFGHTNWVFLFYA